MRKAARRRSFIPTPEPLDPRRLLSGFTPAEVRSVYGFDDLAFTSATGETIAADGAGQTIAIVAAYHNPNLKSDLKVFEQTYGLPAIDLTVVNLAGNAVDSTWASESAMDVQWAHALAPAASIVLVEAESDSGEDMLAAIETARNYPGVTVVSMSFGFTETPGQHSYDSLFTTPTDHVGITFIAAAGDHGPSGGAMFPASSTNVLGVGGTTLTLDATGEVESESLWSKSASGMARYAARPAYQSSFQQGAKRSTPDVSFLGDPDTGVAIYHTAPGASAGSWRTFAGTSLGAPAWAAIVAIVNQGRALEGKGSLDGPSETLQALYQLAGTDAFRAVGNTVSATAAGLGVPNVSILAPALIDGSTPTTATETTTTTTAATATATVTVPGGAAARRASRRQALVQRRRQAATVTPRTVQTSASRLRLVRQALRRQASAVA